MATSNFQSTSPAEPGQDPQGRTGRGFRRPGVVWVAQIALPSRGPTTDADAPLGGYFPQLQMSTETYARA